MSPELLTIGMFSMLLISILLGAAAGVLHLSLGAQHHVLVIGELLVQGGNFLHQRIFIAGNQPTPFNNGGMD